MGEIIESEREMVLTAPDRYRGFYDNVVGVGSLLQHGITGLPASRDIFAMFASQVKKHYLLAQFSFVRLHQIQGRMNLRQVLEAGAAAAYAIAHNDPADFADADAHGILDPAQKLTLRRYKWLDEHYPRGSASLKALKAFVNDFGSHASIVQTGNNFGVEEGWFTTSFFDVEDPYFVKTDLWLTANVGLGVLDLFFGVNRDERVLTLADDFAARLSALAADHGELRQQMIVTERFQKADQIAKARSSSVPSQAS